MDASSTEESPAADAKQVHERMEHFLNSRIRAGSRVVQCEFREGLLLIRGNVSSFYVKQTAQEFARQIPGVEQVANHLTVVRARQVA